MKNVFFLPYVVCLLLFALLPFSAPLIAAPPPALSIRAAGNGQITLSWPASAPGFAVEQASALGAVVNWQPVAQTPVQVGNEFSLTVAGGAGNKFFRLRRQLTTVNASSPVNGETGVAVTRETIVHFSAPLATNAVITTDNFFAGFGGRRVLSRVELSSDRKKASLFYLEPLPGSARVVAVFDGTGIMDEAGAPLDADGNGVPGGAAIVAFDTLNLTALPNTAVIGKVFASELVPGGDTGTNAVNKPLAGVTITVDGMEQTLRAVTDATGSFTLSPAPPGRFFVHIDGRTVTNDAAGIHYPDKAYYPYVGKAWEAVAGVTNNPAGGTGTIFLPLIVQGTLQPVSLTSDTTISFPSSVVSSNPALAGVSVTVPANSLFADDGRRGGLVGIAAVPPDRLPGPLPPGAEMPLVITVQTDGGLNFDKPAPICFPNLPNPTTKKAWPPGTKGSLISFNHKKGVWEDVGDMTVSADGKFFCTDPGVGIVQPGWHGPQCPKASKSPPPPDPKDDPCYIPGSRDYAFDVCLNNAQFRFGICKASALYSHTQELKICDTLLNNEVIDVDEYKTNCAPDATLRAFHRSDACKRTLKEQLEGCRKCFIPPVPSSNANTPRNARSSRLITLAGASTPVEEQIDAISDQILSLISPFASSGTSIPLNVLDQVANLRQQAAVAAGGDLVGFLERKIIAAEEQSADALKAIGLEPDDLNPGNAPPYPVLYAARIARPQGLVILRGQTEPFGQYTLFLPPDGDLLDVSFYDPKTKQFGIITPNLSPKARYPLPRFNLIPLDGNAADFDKDGLPNIVEDVYGTDPDKADTDGDGIPDGAEVEQGTDPLGGLVAQTGVVGTVKTPGAALDVWTGNDLAITAEGASGISVVNISTIRQPTMIAHMDTPGEALRVAASGNFVAVADGSAGLAVIDINDPVTVRIVHQINLPGAQAVAADAGLGYVGLSSGHVAAVDLQNGVILSRVNVSNAVQDLVLEGDYLYALTGNRLLVLSLIDGNLNVVGSAASPFTAAQNQRLFVGGGIAYTAHRSGYNTLDVTNPVKPVLLAAGNTAQFGWRQIVANGAGLGLAVVGPNSIDTSPRDLSLYDLADPRQTDVVVTAFPTPGNARAVSLFNGLAYVADDTAGLQVVNYLPYDSKGLPPTISLVMSFPTNGVEEARLARVTAQVGDDVQVRNVEFYLDGVKAFTDAAFPFEFRFAAPRLAANKNTFRLRARAVDTGGNFTWTEESTISLLPDTTPPRVTHYSPLAGAKTLTAVAAYFDGPMNSATLNGSSFTLIAAGNDGKLGTADDSPVSGGSVSYQTNLQAAALSFGSPLPDGLYRATLTTAVTDSAGNHLPADFAWQFRVADAVFWITTTDGLWSDPLNWSTGAVPGPNDNVIIDLESTDVAVTHGTGTTAIKSLFARERIFVTAGTLQVSNGIQTSGNLTLDRATIRGGTLVPTDGAKLICLGNQGSTLDGVTLHGDLDVTSPLAKVTIRNGLKLTGNVLLDRGGILNFVGNQTFDSGGIIFGTVLGGAIFPNTLTVDIGTTLTLGPAVVVRGHTATIGGNGTLINQGLLSADVAGGTLNLAVRNYTNTGTSECRNGGSLTLSATSWNNTGVLNATGSGALTFADAWINTGTINLDGGTVNLGGAFTLAQLGTLNRTGGTVKVTGVLNLTNDTLALNTTTGSWQIDRGTITGGTVTESNGAKLICIGNQGSTLDGVTLHGDLDVTSPLAKVTIRNGLKLTGNVLLDRGGILNFIGDQTFDSGSILFGSILGGGLFPNTLTVDTGTTLTLGPAVVVRGQSGAVQGGGKFINQGSIAADIARGTITISPAQFENTGMLTATAANATLRVTTKPFINTGTIQEANGGKVTIVP